MSCFEFRLAHEEYLDEFLSVVLQIGEHAQCFKGLGAEVVGLVDDDGGVVSLVETIDEKGVELLQHVGQGHVLSHGQFEILGNGQEKILAIQYGIENPGGGDLFLFQHGQQLVQRRCLADTDFALQNQESFSACYTVIQFLKNGLGAFRLEKTCRTGSRRKRVVVQPDGLEKIFRHVGRLGYNCEITNNFSFKKLVFFLYSH
jgi:hypothetical protein